MYEYIQGKIKELTPTYVVIETGGIGYLINVSLNTFSKLQGKSEAQIFLHPVIREDTHLLYGFSDPDEREIFRRLISVSGIGANTARMILSSMKPMEVRQAIVSGNVSLLKSIKGIGAKSAERIIVDLKDKVGTIEEDIQIVQLVDNTLQKEALSALEILGFSKKQSEKIVAKLLVQNPSLSVEDLIKQALKML